MKKAFITFVTKPNIRVDGQPGLRSRWPDLILEADQKHVDYIEEMFEGRFPADIMRDPRTTEDLSQ